MAMMMMMTIPVPALSQTLFLMSTLTLGFVLSPEFAVILILA